MIAIMLTWEYSNLYYTVSFVNNPLYTFSMRFKEDNTLAMSYNRLTFAAKTMKWMSVKGLPAPLHINRSFHNETAKV